MNIERSLAEQVAAQITVNRKKWLALLLAVFIIGLALGAWAMHSWYVSDLREALAAANDKINNTEMLLYEEQQKPPKIDTVEKIITKFAYGEKEDITTTDAAGNKVTSKEKTDVSMNVTDPTVYMSYRGQTYAMPGIAGETTKFEKGKLTGEISTTATIDVTELVNKEIALQRESDQKVLSAKLAELKAKEHRPKLDLIGGAGTLGAGVKVDRVGLDYINIDNDNKILFRYTVIN